MIVVITAGSVTSQINFWFSEQRTGSEGSTLPGLLIPAVMRPAVKRNSVVISGFQSKEPAVKGQHLSILEWRGKPHAPLFLFPWLSPSS